MFKTSGIEYLLIGGIQQNIQCENVDNLVITEAYSKVYLCECHGTASYIISKSACVKLINYFHNNRLTVAIDCPTIYKEAGVDMYMTNEWLAEAPFYGANNYCDTDIQNDHDCLVF